MRGRFSQIHIAQRIEANIRLLICCRTDAPLNVSEHDYRFDTRLDDLLGQSFRVRSRSETHIGCQLALCRRVGNEDAAFRRYWTTLAAELDANRDGRITFEEYTACVLSPERFDATLTDFAEALAALGDPNGDGLIERGLFVALMTAIGFERANIDALFDAFQPSDDDQIEVSVWAAGIKDYYGPEKAGIPGDHLVAVRG